MPLVSQSIISTWYSKNSWVYRHFSYLFVNPLWKNRVPNGFSLCPYFWCALFSLFIFRPFVSVLLLARRIIRFTRLTKMVEWTDEKVNCVFNNHGVPPFGAPTLLGIGLVVMAIIAVYGLVNGCQFVYILGHMLHTSYAEVNALPFLYLPIFLATALMVCLVYRAKMEDTRCQPEVYVRIAAIVSIIIAVFVNSSAALEVITTPVIFVWNGVVTAVSYIWEFITWTSSGIWEGIKSAVFWMVKLFVAYTVTLIGILATLGIAGWLATRYEPKEHSKQEAEPIKPPSDEEMRAWVLKRAASLVYHMGYAHGGAEYVKCSPIVQEWVTKQVDASWKDKNLYADESFKTLIQKITEEFRKAEGIREAARKARAERCARITGTINGILIPVGRGIVWPFKQGLVLCVYLWQLGKARKQGACPYLPFTD